MNSKKVWIARHIDLVAATKLQEDLGISSFLARLLAARGVMSAIEAKRFLDPKLKDLMDPKGFIDMEEAVIRISSAIRTEEVIGIFGDYDVDGISSAAMLQQFLASLGAKVVVTLPNRMTEGYGLSRSGVDRLHSRGARLLITVDCGILAHDQIDYANSIGCEVIVVDHHTVGKELPRACAVINPKRADCPSGAEYLCAAGLVFFLCAAIRRHLRQGDFFLRRDEPDLRRLLDLVALATVCDIVPLIGDNRILVKGGLSEIKNDRRIGIKALIEACAIDKHKISSTNLGFHLGPRINAAGRLEDADIALAILSATDLGQARDLAAMLDSTNQARRELEERTVDEVCSMIESEPLKSIMPALVFHHEDWHPGVVGIVASRIAERYHRPAIIIGRNGKGSGRSIKGIDLHNMVMQASGTLASFGGHAHAIGLALGSEGVEAFRQDLLGVMLEQVSPKVFDKEMFYDAELTLNEIDLPLIDEMARLEPFGAKNPHPVIRLNQCFMRNLRRLSGGHIKGELESLDGYISFIGFRMSIDDALASTGMDILGVLEKNDWQGQVSPQIRLIDYQKRSPSI